MRLDRLRKVWRVLLHQPFIAAAIVWRRTALRNATVVGITGSIGKTTTKQCLASILRLVGPTMARPDGSNGRGGLPQLLLKARPRHRFVVAEVGILKRNRMWRSAFVLRPNVSVITAVNWQHSRSFGSLETIAREKAKLLDGMKRPGLAVLNGDDPRVAVMAARRECEVALFGASEECEVRAEVLESSWPDRFTCRLTVGGQTAIVRTPLFGSHWLPSILAAATTALRLGASFEQCVAGIEGMEPFHARMTHVPLPTGADLIRDEYNGSWTSFTAAIEFLQAASAQRKIVILGTITDAPEFGDELPERVGRAAAFADIAVFWGPRSERIRQAAIEAGMAPDSAKAFQSQRDVADFLKRETRQGDLIVLKGGWFDHMSRIVFSQFGDVGCRLEHCRRPTTCDGCPKLCFKAAPGLAAAVSNWSGAGVAWKLE